MTAFTYENVIIAGSLTVQHVKKLKIEVKPNKHAYGYLSAIIFSEIGTYELVAELENRNIIIRDNDGAILFSGIIFEVSILEENGYFELNALLRSGSWALDQEKKSCSFQNISMTYEDVISTVLVKTTRASFSMSRIKDRAIDTPIFQYQETDWEFCVRLASHLGSVLYPEVYISDPGFVLGLPQSSTIAIFPDDEYTLIMSKKFYEQGGERGGLYRANYICYEVKSIYNYPIGSVTNFKGKTLFITEKSCELQFGILVFTYVLSKEEFTSQKKIFNEKISGISLAGTVLETHREMLKIHLDIDQVQDIDTAYYFNWVPTTGNFMYLMPKLGTRVSLYFYNINESSARAINCIRTNGGSSCPAMSNYNNRYLTTEHKKQMYFTPQNMGLIGQSITDTPLFVGLDDDNGITIQSPKLLGFAAVEGIFFAAPSVVFSAQTEFVATQANIINGSETGCSSTELSATPEATIDLFNHIDLIGDKTYYACYRFSSYPPFADAPQKASFDCLGCFGKILAGVAIAAAVGVVVAGLTFLTGGAALPVLAAIGVNCSLGTLAAFAGGVTFAAGTIATLGTAATDYADGNVSSIKKYINNSLSFSVKVGADVLSAINILSSIGLISQIGKALGGLRFATAVTNTGMTQIILVGGAVAVEDVIELTGRIGLQAMLSSSRGRGGGSNSSGGEKKPSKKAQQRAQERKELYDKINSEDWQSGSGQNVDLDQKPTAENSQLQNIIDKLYKGQGNPNQIGNGTTMDAVKFELETGQLVEGRLHSQKAAELMQALKKLVVSGELSPADDAIARDIIAYIMKVLPN